MCLSYLIPCKIKSQICELLRESGSSDKASLDEYQTHEGCCNMLLCILGWWWWATDVGPRVELCPNGVSKSGGVGWGSDQESVVCCCWWPGPCQCFHWGSGCTGSDEGESFATVWSGFMFSCVGAERRSLSYTRLDPFYNSYCSIGVHWKIHAHHAVVVLWCPGVPVWRGWRHADRRRMQPCKCEVQMFTLIKATDKR